MVYNVGQGYNIMGAGSPFQIETAPCYNNPYCKKVGLKMRETSVEYPSKLYSLDTKENFTMKDDPAPPINPPTPRSIADTIDAIINAYIGIDCDMISTVTNDILDKLNAKIGCISNDNLDYLYWVRVLKMNGPVTAAQGKGADWFKGLCSKQGETAVSCNKSTDPNAPIPGMQCDINLMPEVGVVLTDISNAMNNNPRIITDIGKAISSTMDKYNCVIKAYNQKASAANATPVPEINVNKITKHLALGVYDHGFESFFYKNSMIITGVLLIIIAILACILLRRKSGSLKFRMF